MNKNAFLVSLKYAPGLLKEILAIKENLSQNGYKVFLICSCVYLQHNPSDKENIIPCACSYDLKTVIKDCASHTQIRKIIRRSFQHSPPALIWIYNPHPLNRVVAQEAGRAQAGSRRILMLHEPYTRNRGAYGRMKSLYIWILDKIQSELLRHMTDVVLPSNFARELYEERYPAKKCAEHVVPLLLEDRLHLYESSLQRKYVSFIGTVNAARNLDDFIALANHAIDRGHHLEFLIATRSNIAKQVNMLSSAARDKVTLINQNYISDEEIAQAVRSSLSVFLTHREGAQSGNIPVAFMQGTPVLARNIPALAQDIAHRETGFILPENFSSQEALEGICFIKTNLTDMSRSARTAFKEKYSSQLWSSYYDWLVNPG